MAAHVLTRQLDALGVSSQLKRSLLFTWDEARSSNLIFVGGQSQNPALAQFTRLEKFNFIKDPHEDVEFPMPGIRNEKPLAGEQTNYISSYAPTNGTEYAVVALVPGVSPSRRILILAGASTFGTEAAADFACDPASLDGLLFRLHVSRGGKVPTFEALLKLDVRGGTPSEPRLELVHRRSDASGATK